MKKTLLLFVLAAGLMMSLSSCVGLFSQTHILAVDKNAPVERSAKVTFVNKTEDGHFFIKEWNNKNIITDLYGERILWSSTDKTVLTVPAGDNSFTFNVYFSLKGGNGTTRYTYDDIELRQNLEPGKEYRIKGKLKSLGFMVGLEFFVEIYDITNRATLLKEWKVGEIKFWEK